MTVYNFAAAVDLANALGIDPSTVSNITIRASTSTLGVVEVEVTSVMTLEQIERLSALMKKYKLVEIQDDDGG